MNQYENVLKEELQGEIIQKVTLETDYHLIHYFLRYSVICNDGANTKLRVGFGASGALVLLDLVLRVNTVRYQSSRPFYLIFESTISGWISGTHSSFRVEQRIAAKVLLLFFGTFYLVLTKFSFWQGE